MHAFHDINICSNPGKKRCMAGNTSFFSATGRVTDLHLINRSQNDLADQIVTRVQKIDSCSIIVAPNDVGI